MVFATIIYYITITESRHTRITDVTSVVDSTQIKKREGDEYEKNPTEYDICLSNRILIMYYIISVITNANNVGISKVNRPGEEQRPSRLYIMLFTTCITIHIHIYNYYITVGRVLYFIIHYVTVYMQIYLL